MSVSLILQIAVIALIVAVCAVYLLRGAVKCFRGEKSCHGCLTGDRCGGCPVNRLAAFHRPAPDEHHSETPASSRR